MFLAASRSEYIKLRQTGVVRAIHERAAQSLGIRETRTQMTGGPRLRTRMIWPKGERSLFPPATGWESTDSEHSKHLPPILVPAPARPVAAKSSSRGQSRQSALNQTSGSGAGPTPGSCARGTGDCSNSRALFVNRAVGRSVRICPSHCCSFGNKSAFESRPTPTGLREYRATLSLAVKCARTFGSPLAGVFSRRTQAGRCDTRGGGFARACRLNFSASGAGAAKLSAPVIDR